VNLDEIEKRAPLRSGTGGGDPRPAGTAAGSNRLFQLRKRGAIGFVRRGRRIFFKGEHLLQYLDAVERKRKAR
jgi:hypothetical protein